MADIIITVVSGETTNLGLSIPGTQGPVGPVGPVGPSGATGPAGPTASGGMPSGGTTGQIIVKQSATNYDAAWVSTASGLTLTSTIASGLTLQGATSLDTGAVTTPSLYFTGDPNTGLWSPGADTLAYSTGGVERTRIDSSGRLLLGATALRANFYNSTINSQVLFESNSVTSGDRIIANVHTSASASGPTLLFGKGRSASIGGNTVVVAEDSLGELSFQGNDGTEFVEAANIKSFVDGTPGANDMPGRLVLSTTLDGATAPTEAWRITNDRTVCYNQADVISKSTLATLTIAELKNGIIQYTGAAQTLTLPTGTLSEAGFSGIYTNMTFQWSVINTGSGICTIGAGASHTIIGAATVAVGASARFATRRTAANTFISYRLS